MIKKEGKKIKTFVGTVVSDKMDKTCVVKVDDVKTHPKYHKQYKFSKTYKVHDEKNECKTGDKIEFVACRPISKDKKWRLINKIK